MDALRRPLAGSLSASFLAGAGLAAATAPLGVGPLVLTALVPFLLAAIGAGSAARGAACGAACGLAFFGLGFLWVPLGVGEPVLWGAFALGVPLLAAPLAALGAALALAARRLGTGFALAAFPAAWVALETLRASGAFGTPWLRLGDALATWPALAQTAALGGVALLSGWVAAVNAALAFAALAPRSLGRRSAAIALLAGPALGGALRLAAGETTPRSASTLPRVAAIQPDVASRDRHVPARFDDNLARLLALSREARAAGAELLVWPESAFERTGGEHGDLFLGTIANHLDAPVLAGLRRAAAPGSPERWNSVALATPDGVTHVAGDKVRPVPLYERAPDTPLARRLARAGWWPGNVRAAASPGVVDVPLARGGTLRAGILLCIDSAHPDLARALRRRGAQLLVSPANEAESGPWSARQHAALARLRAIETGLPLVRAANTGPSVWIDAYGREIARIEAGVRAMQVAAAGPPIASPPYARWGATPAWLCLLAPIAIAGRAGVAGILRARSLPGAQRSLAPLPDRRTAGGEWA